jgi:hypothetical protein
VRPVPDAPPAARVGTSVPDALPPDDAALTARARADAARRRAAIALDAAEDATTEYARRAHRRAADLQTLLARSHEDHARRLRTAETTEP